MTIIQLTSAGVEMAIIASAISLLTFAVNKIFINQDELEKVQKRTKEINKNMKASLVEFKLTAKNSCNYIYIALINLEKTKGDYSYKNPYYKTYLDNFALYSMSLSELSTDLANVESTSELSK